VAARRGDDGDVPGGVGAAAHGRLLHDPATGDALAAPLAKVLGAGAKKIASLGPTTVGDLLRYYPRRYQDPGTYTEMARLAEGEHVTIVAKVVSATTRTMQSRPGAILTVRVTDGHDDLQLTFFARSRQRLLMHERRLVPGAEGMFTGTVGTYRGTRQLTHPEFLLLSENDLTTAEAQERARWPRPLYPASAKVTTLDIQKAVATVLGPLSEADLPDPLPEDVRRRRGLLSLADALHQVHVPHDDAQWRAARRRLRFEEAFVLQTELARRRSDVESRGAVPRPPRGPENPGLLAQFDARLPFTLTRGQRAVGAEIAEDLARPTPMLRLLQGDVGSGKTVVALRAMLQVVDAGGQAVLLAPTEVLAVQHARSMSALLGELAEGGYLTGAADSTRVTLLTGSLGARQRREALLDAASGSAGIVVGTHALLAEHVQLADLGLVVVDEQHRFGVEQRDLLRTRFDVQPHMLVMTATPIPRTVAMTVFGDLVTSTLDELPAGRAEVTTVVVPADNPTWTARVWARVREEVDAGRRAFVVCPRISADPDLTSATEPADDEDEADVLDLDPGAPGGGPEREEEPRVLRAVDEVLAELQAMPVLDGVRIGELHGRMTPPDKDAAMSAFAAGQLDVLVATTVIEVGVDVPAASAMVVLDADRFGISQLHQLRGRVGRGSDPGVCLLVSSAPEGSVAAERLAALAATTDGFALARKDLELRNEGDVLGGAQSGRSTSLRLLRVLKDEDLIEQARQDAVVLVADDPALDAHPVLLGAIQHELAGREEFIDRA